MLGRWAPTHGPTPASLSFIPLTWPYLPTIHLHFYWNLILEHQLKSLWTITNTANHGPLISDYISYYCIKLAISQDNKENKLLMISQPCDQTLDDTWLVICIFLQWLQSYLPLLHIFLLCDLPVKWPECLKLYTH